MVTENTEWAHSLNGQKMSDEKTEQINTCSENIHKKWSAAHTIDIINSVSVGGTTMLPVHKITS